MSEINDKIHFELHIEEDCFPPIGVESLNGVFLSNNVFRIDNTPFFVLGVALGDVVICNNRPYMSGRWFESIKSESGNKALSIIFIDESCKEKVYKKLKEMGCYCEYGEFCNLKMLAVCVFLEDNFIDVSDFLILLENDGLLSYSELCI